MRIQQGASILSELPHIHAALKAAPEAERTALIAHVEAQTTAALEVMAIPLPLIVQGFVAAESCTTCCCCGATAPVGCKL